MLSDTASNLVTSEFLSPTHLCNRSTHFYSPTKAILVEKTIKKYFTDAGPNCPFSKNQFYNFCLADCSQLDLNLTAASNVISSNTQYIFYDELYKLSSLTLMACIYLADLIHEKKKEFEGSIFRNHCIDAEIPIHVGRNMTTNKLCRGAMHKYGIMHSLTETVEQLKIV